MNSPKVIRFTVPLRPKAKARPRTGKTRLGRTIVYTDSKTAQWERAFSSIAAINAPAKPLTGALGVRLEFMLSRPGRLNKRSSPAGPIWHEVKPDLDNLIKSALDALQMSGRFFDDDKQIAELIAGKRHHAKDGVPEVYVELYELEAGKF